MYPRSFSRARAHESGARFVENSWMISWETSSTTRFTSSLSSWEMSEKICSRSRSFS